MKLTAGEIRILNRMISETLIYMYNTDCNMRGAFFKCDDRNVRIESFNKLKERKLIEKFKLEKYGKTLRHACYALSEKGIKAVEEDEEKHFARLRKNKTNQHTINP